MKASDNEFPSLLLVEGATPASPAAGDQRLFIDEADHALKRVDSAGTVTSVEGGGGGGAASLTGTKVVLSSDYAFTADASWLSPAIPWSSAEFDDIGAWDAGSPSQFTIPVGGLYLFGANPVAVAGTASRWVVNVFKNGTLLKGGRSSSGGGASVFPAVPAVIIDSATAGDAITVKINAGGSAKTGTVEASTSAMWLVRLA